MEKGKPHVATELMCPVLKKTEEVGFDVNVFRNPDHGGLEVTACSEFLAGLGAVTCGKDCIHTPEAREIHRQEVQKHLKDLSKIGRNVIG